MKFVVLIYSNASVDALAAARTTEEQQATNQIYWDVERELEASGELIDSKAIDESSQKFVRVNADGSVEVDGVPAPPGGEVVTGYYLLDVLDEARAFEIGARFPEAKANHGIRVARVWTQADFDAL
jgi:hypothetical protein